jgi:hypothetical protein
MKVLTWVLVVFSSMAVFGLMVDVTTSSNSDGMWGVLYAGAVIVQGVMVLDHLKKEESK